MKINLLAGLDGNFRARVGTWRLVEAFKHVLFASTQPQFFLLELQALMSTYSTLHHSCDIVYIETY